MNVPDDLLYTESHEWVRREGDKVRIGITDHAQTELTDVVYVELPKVGAAYEAGSAIAVVATYGRKSCPRTALLPKFHPPAVHARSMSNRSPSTILDSIALVTGTPVAFIFLSASRHQLVGSTQLNVPSIHGQPVRLLS